MIKVHQAKGKEEWSKASEHNAFEEPKATSVLGTQRTKGRLEAFTGVEASRLWLGFSCIFSGSRGQSEGSKLDLSFAKMILEALGEQRARARSG